VNLKINDNTSYVFRRGGLRKQGGHPSLWRRCLTPWSGTPVSPHLGPVDRFFTTCITSLPPGVFTTCILLDLVWYDFRVGRVVRLSPMVAVGSREGENAQKKTQGRE